MQLFKHLNEQQEKAVTTNNKATFVIAGAGSGKTRVLTTRIAWLIHENNIAPDNIFAVTFTNKAAAEMKTRIQSMISSSIHRMWIGTFHGLAHKLLRLHYKEIDLLENFQIIDADDQLRLIKKIIKTLNLDEKIYSDKTALSYINNQKDKGLRATKISPPQSYKEKNYLHIYELYEKNCRLSHLIDFGELLLLSYELLSRNPILLKHYQHRFQHILIDEFQDTNNIQYQWIKLLKHNHNHIMVVGDDNQSIYGWRGAEIENIARFLTDFSNVEKIKLEQNYRSTQNILNAANALIKKNKQYFKKTLKAQNIDGEPIHVYEAFNAEDEARYIIKQIQTLKRDNYIENYHDIAILYRSNAQSRAFEEACIHADIPYRIHGGLRFYDRQEIKDVLAYLRLIHQVNDNAALERVINRPTRGIGDKTLMTVRHYAQEQQISLFQSCSLLIKEKILPPKAHNAVQQFIHLIDHFTALEQTLSLSSLTKEIMMQSGIYQLYEMEKGEKGKTRIENLQELVSNTKEFILDDSEEDYNVSKLSAFLSRVTLDMELHQNEQHQDAVQMMTLHSTKGLEFPIVFMTGLEENLFPSYYALNDKKQLEEERRLCYVGITRAEKKLYLTHAKKRFIFGNEDYRKTSRFLSEIPEKFLHNHTIQTIVSSALDPTVGQRFDFEIGQRIRHPVFGIGKVLKIDEKKVTIAFDKEGIKTVVLAYAKLTPL